MVAMMRMEQTTYAESLSSTAILGFLAFREPMTKGMTYMVRPRMEPSKRPVRVCFISTGSRQLLVGPAPSSVSEQMKVRSSTRATSSGSEKAA